MLSEIGRMTFTIPLNWRRRFSGKHVAIRAGRKLLPQDYFRIAPGVGTQQDTRIVRAQLSKETPCQHEDRGSAEGAGEGNHMLVLFSGGAQRQITSLGKQCAMFPAEAQGAAGHIKFETAVCWIGDQPVDQCEPGPRTRNCEAAPAVSEADRSQPGGGCPDRRG